MQGGNGFKDANVGDVIIGKVQRLESLEASDLGDVRDLVVRQIKKCQALAVLETGEVPDLFSPALDGGDVDHILCGDRLVRAALFIHGVPYDILQILVWKNGDFRCLFFFRGGFVFLSLQIR